MKITTVSLSKTIPTGPYMNDKIGLEATLSPGESEFEALDMLNKTIDEWHKKSNPHLYQEEKYPQPMTVVYEKSPIAMATSNTLEAIKTAATLEELKSYKLVASVDKELYNVYNQRVKDLTNGR